MAHSQTSISHTDILEFRGRATEKYGSEIDRKMAEISQLHIEISALKLALGNELAEIKLMCPEHVSDNGGTMHNYCIYCGCYLG